VRKGGEAVCARVSQGISLLKANSFAATHSFQLCLSQGKPTLQVRGLALTDLQGDKEAKV